MPATWTPITALACAVLLSGTTSAARTSSGETDDTSGLLARVIAHTTRSQVMLRTTRVLRAGAVSGSHEAWMEVETIARTDGGFRWSVLREGGSARTRARVFEPLLEAEAQAWHAGARDAAALTLDNYVFTPTSRTSEGILLRLQPRRRDTRLIDGTLTVRSDGSLVRLDGHLAKPPSFWVKRVHVVKRYARIHGLTLPTAVDSTAEIKLIGDARFSMRYRYHEIDGRAVPAGLRASSY